MDINKVLEVGLGGRLKDAGHGFRLLGRYRNNESGRFLRQRYF